MNISIRPRKETDRGGYYCMPLVINVPNGHKDWVKTTCPECGALCWKLPQAAEVEKQGCKGLCTMCALKKGLKE